MRVPFFELIHSGVNTGTQCLESAENWPGRKDCRTLSQISSEHHLPVRLPLQWQPTSISCVCKRLIEFLSG
ncbi:hypothetical protein TNCV_2086511 [Trichonephila clavipes]|nr:hypothetical protein TNCV_2086511 [Trichonephila clavipes]